jgi:uncharacterized membrane protein (DUF2068 family)
MGLRCVALMEATKALVVLVAGFGLLSLIHHDLHAVAERVIARLHLNPAKHTARIFLDALANVNDSRLRLLAVLALSYAVVRLVEAYGLWRARRWAEWFAVGSALIYVPFELYELARGYDPLKLGALIANLLVVAYLVHVMRSKHPRRPAAENKAPQTG